jgi:hypothetical protein
MIKTYEVSWQLSAGYVLHMLIAATSPDEALKESRKVLDAARKEKATFLDNTVSEVIVSSPARE